jgi:AraC-like DNA-binding protein
MASLEGLRLGSAGWPELAPDVRSRTEAQLVFRSALLQVGRFRARPGDRHFRCSGPPGQHVFVFPRSSVRIRHAGAQPFVTDRELVTFYNPHQLYFREAVSPEGDECEWFSLRPDVTLSVASEADPRVEPGSPQAFRHAHGRCDGASYLIQRTLLAAITAGAPVEDGYLEEAATELLARLLRAAAGDRRQPREPGTIAARRRRELAEAARERLALRYDRSESLDDLARELGCSVGHLCRSFRHHTGRTLHAHRDELRLRAALDLLQQTRLGLAELAARLGYASHSHFSAAFRRRFGSSPDWLRRRGTQRGLRQSLQPAGAGDAA